MLRALCLAAGLVVSLFSSSHAAVIVFQTPVGATGGGQPVKANATFVTSANHVQVTLSNLQADPTSVVQCLSGLQFHLSGGQTSGSIDSSSGLERNIAGNGSFTDASPAAMGWSLGAAGSDLKLNLLGTMTAPDHTIIGPPDGLNVYSNANNSIVGGSHSPFTANSAVWELSVTGVTALSTVTSATFQFNTSSGTTSTGNEVPEPAALTFATVLATFAMRRHRPPHEH